MSVEVLLFDLGGVLVDFSGVPAVAPMLGVETSESEIRDRWSQCPHNAAFQHGELTAAEFGRRFVSSWGLVLTPDQFLQEFRTWSRALLPGAADLLALLRPRFRLAALSNSNELHWERNTTELGITGQFEVKISSHQVGLSKPDPRIYRAALDRLNVLPDAVMFFDAVQANVEAAAALGIRTSGARSSRFVLVSPRRFAGRDPNALPRDAPRLPAAQEMSNRVEFLQTKPSCRRAARGYGSSSSRAHRSRSRWRGTARS